MKDQMWLIGWFWFWFIWGCFATMLLPLLLGGKYRLPYGAALSLFWLIIVCTLGLRGIYYHDQAVFSTGAVDFTGGREAFHLSLASGKGGFKIAFLHDRDLTPQSQRKPPTGPALLWHPGGDSPTMYPQFRDPLFQRWGFQLTWFSEPPRPGTISNAHLWAVIFPVWVPIPFLLLLPTLYLHRRWLKPRRRQRQHRCIACGYDLRAHQAGEKCPECGAIIANSPKKEAKAKISPKTAANGGGEFKVG